ncbi:Protein STRICTOSIDINE SYNTHASE-LIKE 3 like [Actinidia chinensis var. chinensis]|uniref:Protein STRICTOSIDINE SYNTHASE-LIKE 3 like n=1 Tax=Actinidia chinensis var. chinensis TaxID=1590841 RepID=A0A2R6PAZ8_ACTCC|nr:Protein STRICTOSIDINE SYNTHASE-LIKE 3 like [Actinidia chinensis var. chinensis]
MSLKIAPITIFSFFLILFVGLISARKPHVINFRSPNLYPESVSWDPSAQHFVVGSFRNRTLHSVSDAAVVDTLVYDPNLPPNSTILGVTVDNSRRRLLATVNSMPPLPAFTALAAYDLRSPDRQRLFLTPLHDPSAADEDRPVANDVTVDFSGNAFVTNSAGNFIWKKYSFCGINGVVYISNGYLLAVQSNTGKMFKVNADDGTAQTVLLNKDLTFADGIAVRSDGVVVVVSHLKAYFIKSDDSWSEGVVFDETALEAERFATSVTIGGGDRVYVLYGHVDEGQWGNVERETFRIVEIESDKEQKEDSVWIYVLVGLGFAYFCFWRFQMRQLVTNMNKKTA